MSNKIKINTSNIIKMTQSLLSELSYFEEDGPIKANFTEGHEKILIITGENASGKSFIRRLIQLSCKQEKVELIHLSQEARTMGWITSAFVYGSESYDSTGYNSSNTITTGISTCQSRESDHYILWDEPDIGLSERYSGGVGVAIRKFVENLPKHTRGCVVITHSKALVKQLLSLNPSHLRLGDDLSLNDWMNEIAEPGDLKELQEKNHKMFRLINEIIKG